MEIVIVGFVALFVLMLCGAPIAIAIGMSVVIIWFINPAIATSPAYIFQSIVTSLDVYVLLAVPLFILSGIIMAKGGIAKKLFDFFAFFIGGVRGGMPCTVIVTCLFYGALSGSGPGTVAAVGAMSIPILANLGYEKSFATALVCVAGGLGVVIPPSIPMVIYGQAIGASVGNLFIAGILPGILIGVCLMVYANIYCRRKGEDRAKLEENVRRLRTIGLWGVFKDSFWALLTPVIILGGIYSGIVTPTEAACVSVIYSLIVSLFVYKSLSFKQVPAAFFDSVHSFAPMIYIVGVCTSFARAMAMLKATDALTEWMYGSFSSTVTMMLAINVLLLIIGCMMDTTAAILICAPLLWPLANAMGLDIVHFGIIMIVNLAIGFVTPPVGANLFVAQAITKLPITQIIKQAFPFLIFFIIALMLITFIPAISLFLI
jgi:C4-dicarboxylate transporter DctM subunit